MSSNSLPPFFLETLNLSIIYLFSHYINLRDYICLIAVAADQLRTTFLKSQTPLITLRSSGLVISKLCGIVDDNVEEMKKLPFDPFNTKRTDKTLLQFGSHVNSFVNNSTRQSPWFFKPTEIIKGPTYSKAKDIFF